MSETAREDDAGMRGVGESRSGAPQERPSRGAHTPGPWETFISGEPPLIEIWGGEKNEVVVAWRGFDGLERDASLANARLIAAAPDLLEALKALRLQALQSPDLRQTDWGQEALNTANAAIAKAESRP
jgi:hypothetical protein